MKVFSFLILFALIGLSSCSKDVKDIPMEEVSFNVVGMYCDGCVKAIGDRIKKIEGASDVKVTLRDSLVVFSVPQNKVPTSGELSDMLVELGYELVAEDELND
jgi:copper chaperone CopZ